MSANNQILVKQYKNKWYVFNNVMAESWSEKNELSIKEAEGFFDTEKEAFIFAKILDKQTNSFMGFNSEYGVGNKLIKDESDVTLIE